MDYGVSIISGDFGSGKTFGTFYELVDLEKRDNLIISNVPYSWTDIYFDSSEDFGEILKKLKNYVEYTNEDIKKYYQDKKYKNIIMVLDEAQLYFNSRLWNEKKGKAKTVSIMDLEVFMTQCRKRNIKIYCITQRIAKLDKNIRRFADYVVNYKKKSLPLLGLNWVFRDVHYIQNNINDIDEAKSITVKVQSKEEIDESIIEHSFFNPLFYLKILFKYEIRPFLFVSSKYKKMKEEYYNTFFVCGMSKGLNYDYSNFDDLIVKEEDTTYGYRQMFRDIKIKIKNLLKKNKKTVYNKKSDVSVLLNEIKKDELSKSPTNSQSTEGDKQQSSDFATSTVANVDERKLTESGDVATVNNNSSGW